MNVSSRKSKDVVFVSMDQWKKHFLTPELIEELDPCNEELCEMYDLSEFFVKKNENNKN